MAEAHQGVHAQPRKDLAPPEHWRIEAVIATPKPRSLSVGRDGATAVFIQDGNDASDVWLLDLAGPSVPERLTTLREPQPWWEDTTPRMSPDGRLVAHG